VYLATFSASFRIASPPSIIHSPFAPSVFTDGTLKTRRPRFF
jgi:hypothetical protein